MKITINIKSISLFVGMVLFGWSSHAQYSPTAVLPITITENNGVAVTDYQVLLTINTQAMVLAGTLQANCFDLRFGADGCMDQMLPHWIESGINTPTTKVWVKVPSLPATSSLEIYMFGGDPLATNTSDFTTVFPNAIITNGTNATIGGTAEIGWLQVDANDTLFITAGSVAELSARKTLIEGVIMANGAGYAGGIIGPNTGSGSGGGTGSVNAGCGGGSYAGIGGSGGYDAGDVPGAGGVQYGTTSGLDIDAGSGGGSSNNTFGGNGGGGINIRSEEIVMNGAIFANGVDGQQPGGSRGGGGGAGGGVLLEAHEMTVNGSISANGGNGSVGVIAANDDGGGGGGGRIKLFYSSTVVLTGIPSVSGGVGGPNGDIAGGITGGDGSIYQGVHAFNPITYSFGTPGTPQSLFVTVSEPTASVCLNEPLTFTANGIAPFDFQVNGSSVQNGATNFYTSSTLSDGDVVTVLASGCSVDIDVTVFDLPVPTITETGGVLDAGAGFTSYQWQLNGTDIAGATSQTFTIINGGDYTVTVTNANNCSGTSAILNSTVGITTLDDLSVSIHPNPFKEQISVSINASVNDKIKLVVMNQQGQKVYTETVQLSSENSEFILDLAHLSKGMYFVNVVGNSSLQVYKITKQ